ncbi:unnamed protein product [Rotaria sp. Silwood2]|nr:unnamed protein product [Rotaria sp. Silwood2]CAF2936820.1 unnamed protein product [Rotaria sp. Silwood2]CAF3314136.1 unnamed protein product [Rotaria sp. Silwood2]CAF3323402.1 unnamed protein product [Rotaria sp. Silwood2]CAF3908162.1 unnamed protein product [Rotaria sp. Silwood2]
MYIQLLKEIFLQMEGDDNAKKELFQFCRKTNIGIPRRMKIIGEFEKYYDTHTPIWWYTRDCFIHGMINRALRLQEIDAIVQTRFFIQDLHQQIERLYEPPSKRLTLYRGQGLPYGEFQQLHLLKGGLYTFHSFLSTTLDRNTALTFAQSARQDPRLIGIVFHINIDPVSIKSAVFASLDNESYYKVENEFLFTMYTVFRVGEIIQLEPELWQVELSLTSDKDKDLKKLAEDIRQATQGSTGWNRLGKLLLAIGKFDKAEEVLQILIDKSSEDDLEGLGHLYHLMGSVKENKKEYDQAMMLFEKTLNIYRSSLPDSNYLHLTTLYNDIGSVYQFKKEYLKAQEYYEMALDIHEKINPVNDSDLVITYGNLAEIYKYFRDYSQSLRFYQKQLDIYKKSTPLNYLKLATTYENMAEIYYNMKEYTEALQLFRKVSKIREDHLLRNNAKIAMGHNNIGKVLDKMGHYLEAMVNFQQTRGILAKSAPVNFLELAMACYKIAEIYKKMGNQLKALELYHETLINLDRSSYRKKTSSATIHDNIGQIYESIGKYEKAVISYRQAIQIEQLLSSQNDSQLQLYKKHLAKVRRTIK